MRGGRGRGRGGRGRGGGSSSTAGGPPRAPIVTPPELAKPILLPHWPEFPNMPEPIPLESDDMYITRKNVEFRNYAQNSIFYQPRPQEGKRSQGKDIEGHLRSLSSYFPPELIRPPSRKRAKLAIPRSKGDAAANGITALSDAKEEDDEGEKSESEKSDAEDLSAISGDDDDDDGDDYTAAYFDDDDDGAPSSPDVGEATI